jgi:hypothetical protein
VSNAGFFFGNRSFTGLIAKERRESMASTQVTCALDVVFTHVLAYLRLFVCMARQVFVVIERGHTC